MLELHFNPFPYIATERLELRQITMEDEEGMFLLREDIDAMKHLSGSYFKRSREENLENIIKVVNGVNSNEFIAWAIAIKGRPELIGTVSFHKIDKVNHRAEIGYMISPELWGKGLMSEAVKAVIDYGFNHMDLHSIEAHVSPENQPSILLLEKNGFVKEGYLKESFFFKGTFSDTVLYSLVKTGS